MDTGWFWRWMMRRERLSLIFRGFTIRLSVPVVGDLPSGNWTTIVRTQVFSGAFRARSSPVQLDDSPRNTESQPQPAVGLGERCSTWGNSLIYCLIRCRDPQAGVADFHLDRAGFMFHRDGYPAAIWRKERMALSRMAETPGVIFRVTIDDHGVHGYEATPSDGHVV